MEGRREYANAEDPSPRNRYIHYREVKLNRGKYEGRPDFALPPHQPQRRIGRSQRRRGESSRFFRAFAQDGVERSPVLA